jgi:hypothetical protein
MLSHVIATRLMETSWLRCRARYDGREVNERSTVTATEIESTLVGGHRKARPTGVSWLKMSSHFRGIEVA